MTENAEVDLGTGGGRLTADRPSDRLVEGTAKPFPSRRATDPKLEPDSAPSRRPSTITEARSRRMKNRRASLVAPAASDPKNSLQIVGPRPRGEDVAVTASLQKSAKFPIGASRNCERARPGTHPAGSSRRIVGGQHLEGGSTKVKLACRAHGNALVQLMQSNSFNCRPIFRGNLRWASCW